MELRDRRTSYVLDASALLAMLQNEPGGSLVELVMEHSVLSTVNWSEVVQKSIETGVEVQGMRADVKALGLEIQSFTAEDAERAASLRPATRAQGLSLGDRACLALALRMDLTALTADRAWAEIEIPGVRVELLR